MNKIFISYSRKDIVFTRKLYSHLIKDGFKCFLDVESIKPGENWVQSLEWAINESNLIVVVLSPAYCKSQWSLLERTASMATDPTGLAKRICPVLSKTCEEYLPPFLKAIAWVDMSTPRRFEKNYPRLYRALKGQPSNEDLCEGIRRRFGLREVVLVKSVVASKLYEALGQAGATYLLDNIVERSRVGFACANTVFNIVKALPMFSRRMDIYPISFNVDPDIFNVMSPYAALIEMCHKNPQARAYNIPVPAFFCSEKEKKLVYSRSDVASLISAAHNPNIAFFSTGDLGPGSSFGVATPYICEHINPDFSLKDLLRQDACGEINLYPFDKHGNPVDHPVVRLLSCMSLERIRELAKIADRHMVLVAGGQHKSKALLGALRGGYLNVLITDTNSAKFLLTQE